MSGPKSDVVRRLAEADENELLALLREWDGKLEPTAVRKVLRNPFSSGRVLEALVRGHRESLTSEVRREIAAHPRVPEVVALGLLGHLNWRDLARLGTDTRARPRVRRVADARLGEKLPALSVGERMAVARRVGVGAIARVRTDPDPRVVGALLENPRLTEGLLMPLISSERTSPAALQRIARDRKWGSRHEVRATLAKNPSTPVETALAILPSLKKRELRAVAANRRIAPAVRRRAELLTSE